MIRAFALAAAPLALLATPVSAEVTAKSDIGFSTVWAGDVAAAPEEIWPILVAPSKWWSPDHSWTGDSANFFLDTQAGGCFCERVRDTVDGKLVNRGSVEHARVIYADRDKVLRMSGALGPLQSEAVIGTLTVAIGKAKSGTGSRLSISYVVGGYMRFPVDKIAPSVDAVIGEQFKRLVNALPGGGTVETKAATKDASKDRAGPSEEAPVEDAAPEAAPSEEVVPEVAPDTGEEGVEPATLPMDDSVTSGEDVGSQDADDRAASDFRLAPGDENKPR